MAYEPHYHRRGIAPWVWVLIVLAAIILVFVIWWAVAAQQPEREVITVPGEREVEREQPAQQPPQGQQQQPVVVQPERPVNIYIERGDQQRAPSVIVVPQGQQPPEAEERLRQVDLPSRFRYLSKTWEPSDEAVMADQINLKDSGATVEGNIVYVQRDASQPYNELYLETEPGSGIYIKYQPAG